MMLKYLPFEALLNIIEHAAYYSFTNPLLTEHLDLAEQNERNPNLTYPHPFHSPIMEQHIIEY